MGCGISKSMVGIKNEVYPTPPNSVSINISLSSQQSEDSIHKSRYVGLKLLLSSTSSKRAFAKFLCSRGRQICERKTPAQREEITKSISHTELEHFGKLLVSTCKELLSTVMVNHDWSLAAEFCMSDGYTVSQKLMLQQAREIIATCLETYPQFLKSQIYADWKEEEMSYPTKVSVERKAELVSRFPFSPNAQVTETRTFNKALSSVDQLEIERLIRAGSVLSSILIAVEQLPVCVSIATARRDRPGFPLIYVNSAFEKVTGYSRNEIVGQNCRFLQAGKAEPEVIDRLSYALKHAQPVRAAVTNFRKDGMPFKNLLAMKPIFDEHGEYAYVVGVQFDVTRQDATPAKFAFAEEVLRMLPNVFVSSMSSSNSTICVMEEEDELDELDM